MKKVILGLFAALAIIFASCSVNGAGASEDFVFEVDEDFVNTIYSARSALSSENSDDGELTLEIEISGAFTESRTVEYESKLNAAGEEITFEQIPVNKTIILNVSCYIDDELYYEATSGNFSVSASDTPYSLSLILKKLTDTPYALYNSDNVYIYNKLTDSSAAYSFDDLKSAVVTGEASLDENSVLIEASGFDNEGNYFVALSAESGDEKNVTYLGNLTDNSYTKLSLSSVSSVNYSDDYDCFILTGDVTKSDSETQKVFDIVKIVENTYSEKIFAFKDLNLKSDNLGLIAVDGNYIYTIYYSDSEKTRTFTLSKYKMSVTESDNEITEFELKSDGSAALKTVSLSSNVISGSYKDLIVQNGKVYALYSGVTESFEENKKSAASNGALYEFDAETLSAGRSVDLCSSSITYSNFKTFTYLNDEENNLYKLYNDEKCTSEYLKTSSENFTYYGPSDLNGSNYFGPEKFIAKKPRKLIFSDNGFVFSTDNKGILSYKNVNRIITVDISTFEVTSVDQAASKIKFNSELSGNISVDSEKLSALISDDKNLYYKNAAGTVVTLNSENVEDLIYSTYIESSDSNR